VPARIFKCQDFRVFEFGSKKLVYGKFCGEFDCFVELMLESAKTPPSRYRLRLHHHRKYQLSKGHFSKYRHL
jgi:hypothetical protein